MKNQHKKCLKSNEEIATELLLCFFFYTHFLYREICFTFHWMNKIECQCREIFQRKKVDMRKNRCFKIESESEQEIKKKSKWNVKYCGSFLTFLLEILDTSIGKILRNLHWWSCQWFVLSIRKNFIRHVFRPLSKTTTF